MSTCGHIAIFGRSVYVVGASKNEKDRKMREFLREFNGWKNVPDTLKEMINEISTLAHN